MPKLRPFLATDPERAFDRIEHHSPHVDKLFYDSLSVLLSLYTRFKMDDFIVQGAQNIPKTGSFIAASNHRSHMDHAFVGQPIYKNTGRLLNFISKEEFWTEKYGSIRGRFVERGHAIPTIRNTGRGIDGQPKVRSALDYIFDRGQPLIVYPEGTRIDTLPQGEVVGPFKTGVAQSAIRYQVPILPIGIAGSRERDAVVVNFGSLITPPSIDDPTDRLQLRTPAADLTELLRGHIIPLCEEANEMRSIRLGELR
jgi:1-acyl-sn-glycerol-3-phosphate acyltransferase